MANRSSLTTGTDQSYPIRRQVAEQVTLPSDVVEEALSDCDVQFLLEALLLVAPGPATLDELARGAGVDRQRIETALVGLETTSTRGWVVQRHGERIQLASAPRFATQVRRFLGLEREARLSAAALETLAIVAYQQPVTRAEIEGVRGVDCSGVLTTLLSRGLIETVGRLAAAGNPYQYGTTPDFLLHFGMRTLADLPPVGQVEGRDGSAVLESVTSAALSELETKADTTSASTDADTG